MQDNIQYWAVTNTSFRAISSEEYLQPGETLVTGDTPVLPINYVQEAKDRKNLLVSNAQASINDTIRIKLMVGRALSTEEQNSLDIILDYIDLLEALDLTNAPSVNWPAKPTIVKG